MQLIVKKYLFIFLICNMVLIPSVLHSQNSCKYVVAIINESNVKLTYQNKSEKLDKKSILYLNRLEVCIITNDEIWNPIKKKLAFKFLQNNEDNGTSANSGFVDAKFLAIPKIKMKLSDSFLHGLWAMRLPGTENFHIIYFDTKSMRSYKILNIPCTIKLKDKLYCPEQDGYGGLSYIGGRFSYSSNNEVLAQTTNYHGKNNNFDTIGIKISNPGKETAYYRCGIKSLCIKANGMPLRHIQETTPWANAIKGWYLKWFIHE